MPYTVASDNPDCSGWAVVKTTTGEVVGCHETKADALDHLVALEIATEEERALVPAFVSDIDGTLVEGTTPIEASVRRAKAAKDDGQAVVVVTARTGERREETEALLDSIGVEYDRLLMRSSGTAVSHKVEVAKQLMEEFQIVGWQENNPETVAALEELGIPVVAVERSLGDSTEERAVDLSAPEFMRANARRGLKYHEEGLSGEGLVPQTVADARRMAAGEVSEAKWRKISPWIARHLTDLEGVEQGDITPGVVAHLLWGSGSTRAGADRAKEYADRVIAALDNQNRQSKKLSSTVEPNTVLSLGATEMEELREMPPSYRPADSEDVPVMRPSCGSCDYFKDEISEMGEVIYYCKKWDFSCEPTGYCDAYEMKEEESEGVSVEIEVNNLRSKFTNWVHIDKDEKRTIAYSNLEVREAGDGTTLVGYAALWDSPSEPLPWTEYVRRGAFSKTLNDGADVRLLIDHEGVPLARTKSGTLQLQEDEMGLRVSASLDPNNPDAARILSALRRGDLSQMSFAFQTIKDGWNEDRSVRELKEVRLFDVSVVTYPAYEETVASLRSLNKAVTIEVVPSVALRRRQIEIERIRQVGA